jgi:type II secretory pathway component PulM
LMENLKVAKANHEILKGIRSHNRWQRFTKILYWIVIAVIIFGGYVYIVEPFMNRVNEAYTKVTETADSIQETRDSITNFGSSIFQRNKDE